jgi:hypothetical protein
MSVDSIARADDDTVEVVWEVAAGDARAAMTASLAVIDTFPAGRLSVRRYRRDAPVTVSDFAAALSARRVRVEGKTRQAPEVGIAAVDLLPRRCVMFSPLPGQPLVLRWPKATLGTTLVGHAGVADTTGRADLGGPASLTLEVDGQPQQLVAIRPGGGWVRFEASTEPGQRDVLLRVFVSPDVLDDMTLCVTLEARQ